MVVFEDVSAVACAASCIGARASRSISARRVRASNSSKFAKRSDVTSNSFAPTLPLTCTLPIARSGIFSGAIHPCAPPVAQFSGACGVNEPGEACKVVRVVVGWKLVQLELLFSAVKLGVAFGVAFRVGIPDVPCRGVELVAACGVAADVVAAPFGWAFADKEGCTEAFAVASTAEPAGVITTRVLTETSTVSG